MAQSSPWRLYVTSLDATMSVFQVFEYVAGGKRSFLPLLGGRVKIHALGAAHHWEQAASCRPSPLSLLWWMTAAGT